MNSESFGEKTRGGKMKVSLAMLLKTHVEKMSENRSLAMLMKPNELKLLSGDVHENKWGYPRMKATRRSPPKGQKDGSIR